MISTGTSPLYASSTVKISQLQDIYLHHVSVTGDYAGGTSVCVYSSGSQNYTLTAAGSGPANAFELDNGAGTVLPFEARYNDGRAEYQLQPNIPVSQMRNASSDPGCGNGANAYLQLTIRAADAAAAVSGHYSGSVTLIVEPE